MSTFTAVGPRLDLDGPAPIAPPHSLLKTPGVVVDQDTGRWLNGVNLFSYPEDVPSLWEPCSEGTFRVKTAGTDRRTETFDPFVAYLPVTCSTYGVWQPLQEQAEAVLEATLSFAVEQALSQGIDGSANPYFGDANLDILAGGAAVPAGTGLSYLENAIGATGRQGIIHATPAAIAALQAFPVRDPSRLETANGTPVASGGGYQGADPDAGDTPGTTESWLFATGLVQVHLGPLVITDVVSSLDREDNTLEFRAERYVLATFDTALQAGVLVDWAA